MNASLKRQIELWNRTMRQSSPADEQKRKDLLALAKRAPAQVQLLPARYRERTIQ
jgi:hypothetical protein